MLIRTGELELGSFEGAGAGARAKLLIFCGV